LIRAHARFRCIGVKLALVERANAINEIADGDNCARAARDQADRLPDFRLRTPDFPDLGSGEDLIEWFGLNQEGANHLLSMNLSKLSKSYPA